MIDKREVKHFHLFCGLGAGAKGFNRGHARVGNMEARFRCLGGVDVDAHAIADFGRMTGTPGTVLDMFDRDQFTAFHGHEPPAGWQESTAADIQAAAGGEAPNILFLSAPCKGFSGLLSQTRSTTPKYQALNRLTLRGMWLALEAFADDPAELIIFENVPRIANRGRPLLDKIVAMLQHYGYHVAETTHDCGELGGLAQSRKRFLLVARHAEKVPPFLYEPVKRPLRAVGDVLGDMPMPGDELAGAMHRIPRLQWKTWVRLAFVEAGSDWRSLNKLAVEDGQLRDYLIVPEYRSGYLGVNKWGETTGTVAGRSTPTNGAFSIADPRFEQSAKWRDGQAYGVRRWNGPTGAITGQQSPGQGAFAVADPRRKGPTYGKYGITQWGKSSGTVISGSTTGQGAFGVADPRHLGPAKHSNCYRIVPWESSARCITGAHGSGQCIADPRPNLQRQKGDHYLTASHYGVVPWSATCGAVSASAGHDNGSWSVADPRLPEPNEKLVAVIRSLDGTWHRPFTTLELAALQGLIDPWEHLELEGLSDSGWRERIGNAVPPPAAEAIASVMGTTLLLAWSGETFALGSTPIWVRNAAAALSLQQPKPSDTAVH
ncbi:Site-specific DNA-cytosine methylase [Vreelandella subterranea]|uniref:Site-specific DNA-cytosine methylase n=1 Tax=Vreelandella subterranea TaxID=416874 RepID=A0A1H9UQR3_9GAMM|nr:DNA cytosine methyltransferase [Halomonas subterranea]SES11726.1 Site-specific DNA-cytosine methylase [Halomonas subterranea]